MDTPDIAASTVGGKAPGTQPNNGTKQQSKLYKQDTIPGKGKALIAIQRITPGTLIISEPPLITTAVIKSGETIEKDLAQHLRTLPKESQRAFLSLHNNYPGKNPLQNIIRSNGYPLGPSSEVGGVFENISRINHSCLPNAVQAWNNKRQDETVYAVREIPEGSEITLSYHAGGPSSARKKLLKENFGFDCACELCSLATEKLKESDERLRKAQKLDESIGNSSTVKTSPAKVLKDCKALKEIYEQEGIEDDRLARLWYDCFQVCNFHSDESRASAFLARYCDAKKTSSGEDGNDVLEMQEYVKTPKKHDTYGLRSTWKSSVGDVPKDLSPEEYERWLWRETP